MARIAGQNVGVQREGRGQGLRRGQGGVSLPEVLAGADGMGPVGGSRLGGGRDMMERFRENRSRRATGQKSATATQSEWEALQREELGKPLLELLSQVAQGTFVPERSDQFAPMFAQARTGISDQYQVAKENIMSGMPEGGLKERALLELEGGRASQAGSLPAILSKDIYTGMLDKAFAAYPGESQSAALSTKRSIAKMMADAGITTTGMTTESQEKQSAQAREAAAKAAKYQAIGSIVGALGGMGSSAISSYGSEAGGGK